MSPQVSLFGVSSCGMFTPASIAICAKRRRSGPSIGSAAIRSIPAKRSNASVTVIRSGAANGLCRAVAEAELPRARGLCSGRYHRHAIVHEQLVGAVRPVPFEHGKFRMVQHAALTIAVAARELEDPPLASRQKLLAGEFRRGPQIALVPARGRGQLGPHRVDMGLVARRHLERRGLDLHEFQRREQVAHGPGDRAPQHQERAALGMGVRSPKTGAVGHQKTPRKFA